MTSFKSQSGPWTPFRPKGGPLGVILKKTSRLLWIALLGTRITTTGRWNAPQRPPGRPANAHQPNEKLKERQPGGFCVCRPPRVHGRRGVGHAEGERPSRRAGADGGRWPLAWGGMAVSNGLRPGNPGVRDQPPPRVNLIPPPSACGGKKTTPAGGLGPYPKPRGRDSAT